MRKILTLFILLLISFFISCSNPSQSNDIKLTDYENQYQMLYRYQGDLYSIYSDGSNLQKIKDFTESASDFTVNHDYTKIAYVNHSDIGIYVMNFDGSEVSLVTPATFDNMKLSPKFLPAENTLLYYYSRSLYRINIDGSANQKLTPDSITISSDHSSSISGNKIVFAGNILEKPAPSAHIYIMNTDGTEIEMLTDTYYIVSNPVFSPDGNRICYTASINDNYEIFCMNRDGSNKVNLSNSPYQDNFASWSPDGSMISFERIESEVNEPYQTNIYFIYPDGSGLKHVFNKEQQKFPYFFAVWSPDQTRMAFSDVTGTSDFRNTIYIIDIASGSRMKLTQGTFDVIWIDR